MTDLRPAELRPAAAWICPDCATENFLSLLAEPEHPLVDERGESHPLTGCYFPETVTCPACGVRFRAEPMTPTEDL